jgi:hypothetical protein
VAADFTVVEAGSTVAVEAGSMEEVVGLTVGEGTTMSPWSGKSQEVRSGEIHEIGPSLGPTTTLSELPALAHMPQTEVGNLSSAHRCVDRSDPVPVCVYR